MPKCKHWEYIYIIFPLASNTRWVTFTSVGALGPKLIEVFEIYQNQLCHVCTEVGNCCLSQICANNEQICAQNIIFIDGAP